MTAQGAAARSSARSRRITWLAIVAVAGSTGYVMSLVAQHTIQVVRARQLLPRWDLATHLGHGWLDYHLLVTGRIHRLLWDLWTQGYWPPGLSIYQLPFYLVLGPQMTSGLWSAAMAFVLAGVTGAAILWRLRRNGGLLAASLFLALLMSSPFLLAYATVAMTEMLGALGQLVVLLCYVAYRQDPTPRTARVFAISLTLLFFIKYNYFILLAGPLVLYEWLERTSGWSSGRRLAALARVAAAVLRTPTGLLVVLYMAGVVVILVTGGFEFRLLGHRVSVRSIGNSALIVLYLLLFRVWYLHRRGRIAWHRLTSADLRVEPLLLWFVLPVMIWLASPYPNHMRDFANLVINRPLGEPTLEAGLASYLQSLRTTYFYADWVLGSVLAAFAVAAARYRVQPPVIRWLILAIPLQFAAIALHQTRFSRFLLLTVVLLCLVASNEVARWFERFRAGRLAAATLAPVIVLAGVLAARDLVTEERFQAIAFEHYTDSSTLRTALEAIRSELASEDRLVIVGQSNELSPALFRWELGPPSGVQCFPFESAGAGRLDPALATVVLLIEPLSPDVRPLDPAPYLAARRAGILEAAERGEIVLRRSLPVPDLHVVLRLYRPATPPPQRVPCHR